MMTRTGLAPEAGAVAPPRRHGYRLRGTVVDLLTWVTRTALAPEAGAVAPPRRHGYRLRGTVVDLLTWVDRGPRLEPRVLAVLDGVKAMDFRYLDIRGQWHPDWQLPARFGSPVGCPQVESRSNSLATPPPTGPALEPRSGGLDGVKAMDSATSTSAVRHPDSAPARFRAQCAPPHHLTLSPPPHDRARARGGRSRDAAAARLPAARHRRRPADVGRPGPAHRAAGLGGARWRQGDGLPLPRHPRSVASGLATPARFGSPGRAARRGRGHARTRLGRTHHARPSDRREDHPVGDAHEHRCVPRDETSVRTEYRPPSHPARRLAPSCPPVWRCRSSRWRKRFRRARVRGAARRRRRGCRGAACCRP